MVDLPASSSLVLRSKIYVTKLGFLFFLLNFITYLDCQLDLAVQGYYHLELEIQAVVSCLMWVLRIELWSSKRTVVLYHCAMSPALTKLDFQ